MYEKIRSKFQTLIDEHDLGEEEFKCKILAKAFADDPPEPSEHPDGIIEQNFKLPSKEYALAKGKEILVRCKVGEKYGDAFTDKPMPMSGKLKEIPDLAHGGRGEKAIFFATLNATLNKLGLVEGTVHCKEGDPKKCGKKLVKLIEDRLGKDAKIAHIGYQPGHLEACSKYFESKVTDMNPENIGEVKFNRKILDGAENEKVIKEADVACITGSTIANGTLPDLINWCETYNTEAIVYGVTGRGGIEILNIEGFCPLGREKP